MLRRMGAALAQGPGVAARGRLDEIEHAPGLPGQNLGEGREFGLQTPQIGIQGTLERPERGGMAADLLRIAVAFRRPAFGLHPPYRTPPSPSYPPPFTGEVSRAARRRGDPRFSPFRLMFASLAFGTSPASGGG
jgi:hypothetical protein